MTLHFINFESALHSIEEITKQSCNHFSVLHQLTNGYLNLYFKYSGELYQKSYNNIISGKYDENDFTVLNTEYIDDTFLKIKLANTNHDDLYQVFTKGKKLKVGNVYKLRGTNTFHLLQDGFHVNAEFYDEDMYNLYIDMLIENNEQFKSLLMMDSNKKELIELNRYEYLSLNDLYFSSEEIEELIYPFKYDHISNLYTNRERDLANKLLVQFFSERLLKLKPDLSKLKQSKIIASAMEAIKRPLAERTIQDQLKEKTVQIKNT